MIIGSIDIGIRNIGLCQYNSETRSVTYLELLDLLFIPGSTKRLQINDHSVVFLVRRAIQARMKMFQECDIVAIEKQMTRKMILIQFAFECLLDDHTCVFQISPRSVKSMFKTSRGNHASNKVAAIAHLYSVLDDVGIRKVSEFRKKDDVADAILQAMYVAEHADDLLKKKTSLCVPAVKKRKRKYKGKSKKKKK